MKQKERVEKMKTSLKHMNAFLKTYENYDDSMKKEMEETYEKLIVFDSENPYAEAFMPIAKTYLESKKNMRNLERDFLLSAMNLQEELYFPKKDSDYEQLIKTTTQLRNRIAKEIESQLHVCLNLVQNTIVELVKDIDEAAKEDKEG